MWFFEQSTYQHLISQYVPGGTTYFEAFKDGLLMGQPYVQASAMDAWSDVNPAATADHFLVLYGDLKSYLYLTRAGMSVYGPQLLQNTNAGRFDGTVGIMAAWRNAGDVLIDAELAVLSVPTTA